MVITSLFKDTMIYKIIDWRDLVNYNRY